MRTFLVILLCAVSVSAQTRAVQFAKDLRAFVESRKTNDPLFKDWTGHSSEEKESAVFHYRVETMKLWEKSYQGKCKKAAKALNDQALEKSCASAEHPQHLLELAKAFETK